MLPPARGHGPRHEWAHFGPSPKCLNVALRFRRLARRQQAFALVGTDKAGPEFPARLAAYGVILLTRKEVEPDEALSAMFDWLAAICRHGSNRLLLVRGN